MLNKTLLSVAFAAGLLATGLANASVTTGKYTFDTLNVFVGSDQNADYVVQPETTGNISGNLNNGNIPYGWEVIFDGSVNGAINNSGITVTENSEGEGIFNFSNAALWNGYLYAIGLKAGNDYAIFGVEKWAKDGTWEIAGSGKGKSEHTELSHYMVYSKILPKEVPLPAAAWLMLSGLVGFMGFGRKKAAA